MEHLVNVDPVYGKFLVLTLKGKFYEYDVVADARNLSSSKAPTVSHAVSADILQHGVVMYIAASGVYLYKHNECTTCTPN